MTVTKLSSKSFLRECGVEVGDEIYAVNGWELEKVTVAQRRSVFINLPKPWKVQTAATN